MHALYTSALPIDESAVSDLQDELSAVLERLEVPLGPAEAHGLACGLLCSRPTGTAKSRWFSELLDAAGLAADALAARKSDLHALDAWFGETLGALNDAELGFSLRLPDDEVALERRLAALAEYCAGFVYGAGIGLSAQGNPPLPADSKELIEDFMAIDGLSNDGLAHDGAGVDSAGADSHDEESYMQLAEYVRVGVLLIHEELKPVTRAARLGNSGMTSPGAPSRLH